MNTTEYEHSREDIIAANPLLGYCQECGWQLRRDGRRWKCLCPLHNEDTPSFTIYPDKNLWRCFGCNTRGSVIDLHAKLRGLSIGEAMRDLSPHRGVSHGSNGSRGPAPSKPALAETQHKKDQAPAREIAAYDYQDATGKAVYQVVRYEPKTFKQCRLVDGQRVWNMEGVERLPYRLPELLVQCNRYK